MGLIDSLKPSIKALILDMDGVLWKDDQSIGNLPDIFGKISKKGLRVICATNNATKDVGEFIKKFASFGVKLNPDQIVNSSLALAYLLKKKYPNGGSVHIVGESGLIKTLAEHGFHHAEENVLCVVAGLDREITYEKIGRATLLIRKGLPFYATNPDGSYPTPRGIMPGAGSIVAAIEVASDTKPIYAGKPFPTMIEFALERLGIKPNEALTVGDRLNTDIKGGQLAGCRTALVLSGVSTLKDVESWEPKPDLIAPNLDTLLN